MVKTSRRLGSLLVIALIAAIMAGCSGKSNTAGDDAGNSGSPASGTGAEDTQPEATQAEKIKLDLTTWDLENYPNHESSLLKKKLEEKLGVEITITGRKGDTYKDDYKLAILSGEPPDYFTNLSLTDYNEYQSQDLLAEIPDALVEEHAPRLMAYYKKYIGDKPFAYSTRDGKNYALPLVSPIAKNANVSAIREDWLKQVGIDKLPETLDELHEALLRFRNNDPDQDGKKNTYGWGIAIGQGAVTNMFSPVFAAYGVFPGIMHEKDGALVAGEIQPEAKEALKLLNRWYQEELIDPEFVVMNKWEMLVEKFVASKVGYINRGFWEIIPIFGPAPFSADLAKVNPEAKVTVISHPKGPGGQFGDLQGNPVNGAVLAFHKDISQEKMAKYLEFFDDVIFDPEIVELSIFGEEGVHYKKGANGYEWIPPYDDQNERFKANVGLSFGKHMSDFDLEQSMTLTPEVKPLLEDAIAKAVGKYDVLAPTLRPVKDKYGADLGTLSQKAYIDFITGARPIDEFDKYVAEWKAKGGEEMLAESQALYEQLFK